ncbi:MAG: hypothetical protein Q9172_003259 [Xanthocarpia lactea]
MSNATETSFYRRKGHLVSWAQSAPTASSSLIPYDVTTFIATAIEHEVDFVPISWMPGLHRLGRGGTAQIRQTIVSLQTSFAMKQIHFPDANDPDEADIIRAAIVELLVMTHRGLNHPNLLRLEGVCWDMSDSTRPIRPVLITEKSALGDLNAFMVKSGSQTAADDRIEICAQVIDAIRALHANGRVIHGDIKPENILVFEREHGKCYAKLCDFGFASLFANQEEDLKIDLPLSRPWNAPELDKQRSGLSILEAKRADIYSVGIVCAWLLFGNPISLPHQTPWNGCYKFIDDIKHKDGITDYISLGLEHLNNVDDAMKHKLSTFFQSTVNTKPEVRIPTLTNFVVGWLPTTMQCPVKSDLPLFSIRAAFGGMMTADYLLRKQIVSCLYDQYIAKDLDLYRSNAAFQLAVCHRLGFGLEHGTIDIDELLQVACKTTGELATEIELICARDTTQGNVYGNQLLQTLSEQGFSLMQGNEIALYNSSNLHQTEMGCRRELALMRHQLRSGDIVIPQLQRAIATTMKKQGRYRHALDHLSKLWGSLKGDAEYGSKHSQTLITALELGSLLYMEGHYDRALEIAGTVLEAWKRRYDAMDLRIANMQGHIARILTAKECYDRAEELLRQILQEQKRVLGPTHPHCMATMTDLGILLTTLGRHEEAGDIWVDTIEHLASGLTLHHPQSLAALGNIALWLDDLGNFFASEKLYRIKFAGIQATVGPKHPDVAQGLSDLAVVIKHQDRYSQAEEYARKAFEMNEELHGPEHPATIVSLNNLAMLLTPLDRFVEAEAMFRRVVANFEIKLGPAHTSTLSSKLYLANVICDQKRPEEAKNLVLEVIAVCEQTPREDKSVIIIARSQLGACLEYLGDHENSLGEHRAALEAQVARSGEEHPDTWIQMMNFATALHAKGQPRTQWLEAEQIYTHTIAKLEGMYGEGHTQTLVAVFNFARLRSIQGRVEDAYNLFQRAYLGFREVVGEDGEWAQIVLRSFTVFHEHTLNRKN